MSLCLSVIFYRCPVTRNTISGLLMHYGSLDKYTAARWLHKWVLHAVLLHCMCISVCIHTYRAMSADRARLKAERPETVGDTGRESASAQTSSLLCVGFQFHSGAAASDFLWMVPHAAEISVCSPDPHFSSPPLWLLNTRWSCYNVWIYKVLNIWFLHLLKCRFEKRDVKVTDDAVVGVACLSLSVSLMALVFSSMCFCLHSC